MILEAHWLHRLHVQDSRLGLDVLKKELLLSNGIECKKTEITLSKTAAYDETTEF